MYTLQTAAASNSRTVRGLVCDAGARVTLEVLLVREPLSALVSSVAESIAESRNAIVLLGPSGIGKTTAILETDAKAISDLLDRVRVEPRARTLETERRVQEHLREIANLVLGRRFASRLLFLAFLLELDPGLTPDDFLYCQFNGGREHVLRNAYSLCVGLDAETVSDLVEGLRKRVIAAVAGRGPFWAIDEANGLTLLMQGVPVSLRSGADKWLADKNDWAPDAKRSFLSLVDETMQHFQLPFCQMGGHLLSAILRIHLEFLRAVSRSDAAAITQHLAKNGGIMVFITLDSMDEFFVERKDDVDWSESMRLIKHLELPSVLLSSRARMSSSSSLCKVVVFNSSPHKGGNTDHMVQWVSDELAHEGIAVEVVRVGGPGVSLSGCSGCGGCANRNRCVKNDPINDYYQVSAPPHHLSTQNAGG
eukprot:m51a1_g12542 hypothetical protein (422) ;mRNA; r:179-2790